MTEQAPVQVLMIADEGCLGIRSIEIFQLANGAKYQVGYVISIQYANISNLE